MAEGAEAERSGWAITTDGSKRGTATVGGGPTTEDTHQTFEGPKDVHAATLVHCAGIPITSVTRVAAARTVVDMASGFRRQGAHVHLCNAYTLALADVDPQLRAILRQSTLNLPDGKSVIWANRLLYGRKRVSSERISGPELFTDVFALGEANGLAHYLLGSTPAVLEELKRVLRIRFPQANIVGAESPPFRELTDLERIAQLHAIRASGAQVVWLGLGTPKQDLEAVRLAMEVPAVFVAVGAAFDFISGTKRRAPGWMQSAGLEWAFRLGTEPRRLWRRYLGGNLRFIYAALRQH